MFTQKISMDCTKEQYEKYLKDELLKMGYQELGLVWRDDENIIGNNWAGCVEQLASLNPFWKDDIDRLYLGSFNAPLFLALAAMTDKAEGNYGECTIGLRSGRIYKMNEEDKILPEYTMIRKATKEEIMAEFGRNKEVMWKSYSNTTKNLEEIYTSIELLKSKGYKILKPTTWEEV